MVSYTVNEISAGYLRGSIYKIMMDNNGKYEIEELNKYDFIFYPHRVIGDDHLTLMNVCFYTNIKNKNELLTAYTIDNFTDGNPSLPLIARIYDISLTQER